MSAQADATSDAGDPELAADETSDRPPRVHDYAITLGVDGYRFRPQDGARMGVFGPSIGVDYAVGRTFGFALRGVFALPVVGRHALPGEDRERFVLRDLYDSRRASYDVMVGFYYRRELTPDLTLLLAAGAHARLLGLTDAQFQPVELIQGGFSGFARIDYRLSDHFFVGGEFYTGIDPLDFVKHYNRAVVAAPMTLSFSVGARR